MVLKEIYILQKYHQQTNHKYDWHVFTMIQCKQSNPLSHKSVSFQWTQPKKNMTKNIYIIIHKMIQFLKTQECRHES